MSGAEELPHALNHGHNKNAAFFTGGFNVLWILIVTHLTYNHPITDAFYSTACMAYWIRFFLSLFHVLLCTRLFLYSAQMCKFLFHLFIMLKTKIYFLEI